MPAETHRELHADDPIAALAGHTMATFWRWAYSDLHCNTVRPLFAEYLVGVLLGVHMKGRVEWDAVDHFFEGRGVEVKSGAYVQSWRQTRPSQIVFDIAPKRILDPHTNTYSELPIRPAAVYVFCLWPELDREICPTDLTRWRFWVLSTARIQQAFGAQKSVGLTAIQKIAPSCDHTGLRDAVIAALAEGAPAP